MSRKSRKLLLTPQQKDAWRSNLKLESLSKRYQKHPQGNLAEQIAYQEIEGEQWELANLQPSLLPQDSLASLSVLPGSNSAKQMTATSGLKLSQLLKPSNLTGYCLKMLLESSTWHSTLCYLTWKVRTTPLKRLLFQLVPSTLGTDEIGFGLWPTTTNRDWKGERQGYNRGWGIDPNDAIKMLPTPEAQNQGGYQVSNGKKIPRLGTVIGGQLNPNWVEWLMGFPIGWTDLNA